MLDAYKQALIDLEKKITEQNLNLEKKTRQKIEAEENKKKLA